MRNFCLVPFCSLLLAAAACGSDPSEPGDPGGGEIRGPADVQRFFEAIVPELIEAFTAVANELPSELSPSTDKSSHILSIQCPGGGGTLEVNLVEMQTTLTACSVGGVTISASLFLFVSDFGMSMYSANFSGPLMVTGTFNGTVMVDNAFISWTAPATVDNTFWEVFGTVNGQQFAASSAGGGGNSGDCGQCVGVDAAGPGQPSNRATECPSPPMGFSCLCETESGEAILFSLDPAGCIF